MKQSKNIIKAWAIIQEDGTIAHHYNSYAIYSSKKAASSDTFCDGSDKVVLVKIIIVK